MIVLDASVVIAYFNAAERSHEAVARWVDENTAQLVTTPLVLAEIDCVLSRRAGSMALEALRADLEEGVYRVDWWTEALPASIEVARAASAHIGLADASLVALASRIGTTRIATLDQTHFRALTPLSGESEFILLPADA